MSGFPEQCAAVQMVTANCAEQLFKLSIDPTDTAQLKTTRKACELARDTLDGFLAQLPRSKRGGK